MKHVETHPLPVDGCFGCHLLSIQFDTAGSDATTVNLREKRWQRDLPAYKRLRKEGLQPRAIDGCGDLETRASSKLEVEMGGLIPKDQIPRVREGMSVAKEMGWAPAS